MAQEPLSLRAYAAHRKQLGLPGTTLKSVQKAIDAERISVVVVAGAKRIADADAADREWAANTDPFRSLGASFEAEEDDEDLDDEQRAMKDAARREKHWKAQLAELTYKERSGELVDAAAVEAEYANFCTTVRTKLLGLPSRMKQAHSELTLEQLATLDDYVREALEELAAEGDHA